jgi:hypothetical protein
MILYATGYRAPLPGGSFRKQYPNRLSPSASVNTNEKISLQHQQPQSPIVRILTSMYSVWHKQTSVTAATIVTAAAVVVVVVVVVVARHTLAFDQ